LLRVPHEVRRRPGWLAPILLRLAGWLDLLTPWLAGWLSGVPVLPIPFSYPAGARAGGR
jgi:hypothetical protein